MVASAASISVSLARTSRNGSRLVSAKASSATRCAAAPSKLWCSCWPWRSTSSAPNSLRVPTVASRPSTYARERPSRGTTRHITRSVPSGKTKRPSTRSSSAPGRTIPASARCPTSRLMASTTMVLPAPVSPVSAVRPSFNTMVACSITPRFSMCSSTSTPTPTARISNAESGETSAE